MEYSGEDKKLNHTNRYASNYHEHASSSPFPGVYPDRVRLHDTVGKEERKPRHAVLPYSRPFRIRGALHERYGVNQALQRSPLPILRSIKDTSLHADNMASLSIRCGEVDNIYVYQMRKYDISEQTVDRSDRLKARTRKERKKPGHARHSIASSEVEKEAKGSRILQQLRKLD